MPAISRIRLTNIKYNKQLKAYDDLIFDLNNDDKPLHSLISFVNSGGKGVLLQSLFQVLLPETSWGSNNENKVKHFFYNEKERPSTYTMYISIEWYLDNGGTNRLITGIAISGDAIKNDVSQMDINYSLFTYEVNHLSQFQLENLPYHNKETKEVVSLLEWDTFLKSHSSFRKFSKSTKRNYYKYLEEFGIFKEDWESMKKMNRKEAGITDYFENGNNTTTNFGLFYHLIIPAIIDNIQSSVDMQEQKDLITLFKEMALISKNLPILNQREIAYEYIMQMNTVIQEKLYEVKKSEEELENKKYDGSVIHYLLNSKVNTKEDELSGWEKEEIKRQDWQKDYNWQKVNVEFNDYYFKGKKLNEDIELTKIKLNDAKNLEEENNRKLVDTKVNILLIKHKEKEGTRKFIKLEIEQIENQSDFENVKKELDEISTNIVSSWKNVNTEVSIRKQLFNQKLEKLEEEENQLKQKVEKENNKKIKNEVERNNLVGKLNQFNDEQEELIKVFDNHIEFKQNPTVVLNEQNDLFSELETNFEKIKKDIEFTKVDRKKILAESTKLYGELKILNNNFSRLQKEYTDRQDIEEELVKDIYRLNICEFDYNLSFKWIEEQRKKLEKELDKLERKSIPEMEQHYWKIKSESDNAKYDFWIPNHELVELKRTIEDAGIHVMFGTEYFLKLDESEKIKLDSRLPLLKYGLVVFEDELQIVRDVINLDEKTIYTPIPIYNANKLEEEEISYFTLLNNHANLLVTNIEEWKNRKISLSNELTECEHRIANLKNKQEKMSDVLSRIKQASTNTSEDKKQELDKLENEIDLKNSLDEENKIAKEKVEEILLQLKNDRDKSREQLDSVNKKIEQLEIWLKRVEQNKRDIKNYSNCNDQFKEAEHYLGIYTKQLTEKQKNSENWKVTFEVWNQELKRIVDKFKEFNLRIVEVTNEDQLVDMATNIEPTNDFDMFSNVDNLYNQWTNLQSEAITLNSKLVELNTELKYENEAIKELERRLDKLDLNWKVAEIPTQPQSILEQEEAILESSLKQVEKDIIKLDKENGISEANLNNVEDSKEQIKNKLKDIDAERPIEFLEENDLEYQKSKIDKGIKDTKEDLDEIKQTIKNLKVEIDDYKSNRYRISDKLIDMKEVSTIPKRLEIEMSESVTSTITNWIDNFNKINLSFDGIKKLLVSICIQQKNKMKEQVWDKTFKDSMVNAYDRIDVQDLNELESFIVGINNYIRMERESVRAEKDAGEKAKEDWVYNASEMVMNVVEALKRMKSSMTIVNRSNYKFPLIDFQDNRLPKNIEEIQEPLRDFYEKKIKEIINKNPDVDIEEIKLADIKKLVDNSNIVLAALERFPILKIYNLNTDNSFMYDRKKPEYFTEWETINNSSETQAAGSGGQKVAARTLIVMMILNYKRQQHQKGKWNVMISDNPFANAVSVHVVDPIIAVADALKIQWIVVAPPETIKAEVSVKFPVYYPLSFKRSLTGKDIVVQEVQQQIRKYTEQTTLF